MAARVNAHTPVADEIRQILRDNLERGWTPARVAHEMNLRGHKNWTVPVVTSCARTDPGRQRFIAVDEAIDLLRVFRASAQMIERQIADIANRIGAKETRP